MTQAERKNGEALLGYLLERGFTLDLATDEIVISHPKDDLSGDELSMVHLHAEALRDALTRRMILDRFTGGRLQ
jgi:hypothetical protein